MTTGPNLTLPQAVLDAAGRRRFYRALADPLIGCHLRSGREPAESEAFLIGLSPVAHEIFEELDSDRRGETDVRQLFAGRFAPGCVDEGGHGACSARRHDYSARPDHDPKGSAEGWPSG